MYIMPKASVEITKIINNIVSFIELFLISSFQSRITIINTAETKINNYLPPFSSVGALMS
jgi:hypothetical protein